MKISIKTKLTLIVTAILIGVIGLQVLLNQYFAKTYFIDKRTKQLEKLYDDISKTLTPSGGYKTFLSVAEEQHLIISIGDNKEEVLETCYLNGLYYDLGEQVNFKYNPSVEYQLNERSGQEVLVMLGMIDVSGQPQYAVLGTSISGDYENIKLILRLNPIVALGAVLIGGLCIWFFGRRFTKPILEIDRVAQAVADRDFTKRVEETGKEDEIGILGRNINSMSQQIVSLIAELQAANKELEKDIDRQKQVDNMRKDFIANVSHELKSPLALLTMACETLKQDMPHIDKVFYYDIIQDESLRMGRMIKELLELSKLENGMIQMNHESLNFSELVDWVCSKNQVFLENKGIRVKKYIDENIFAAGDRFYLEQAVNNYLDNARRHIVEGGLLSICLNTQGNAVRFCVYNEGDRIPEAELEEIWESFYKSNKAHTYTEEANAGLGLYIVKQIILAHEGHYGVQNKEDGVEFWFTIPIL